MLWSSIKNIVEKSGFHVGWSFDKLPLKIAGFFYLKVFKKSLEKQGFWILLKKILNNYEKIQDLFERSLKILNGFIGSGICGILRWKSFEKNPFKSIKNILSFWFEIRDNWKKLPDFGAKVFWKISI